MVKSVRFTNCKVYTPWETADSVVFSDKVEQVGGGLRGEVEVDLAGALVVPGFVDAHMHMASTAFKLATVDLQGSLKEDVLAYLRSAQPKVNGWVYARGWDESVWGGGYLTADEIGGDHPTLAVRVDGHMGVLNRAGMRRAREMGIEVSAEGFVWEGELTRLMAKITQGFRLEEWVKKAQVKCLELGLTVVCDIDQPEAVTRYLEEPPEIRVVFSPIGTADGFPPTGEMLGPNLYMGHTKLFADGSIGARTAAVSWGYVDAVVNSFNIRRLIYSVERYSWAEGQ